MFIVYQLRQRLVLGTVVDVHCTVHVMSSLCVARRQRLAAWHRSVI